ncbi:MAG: DUF2334 domain-containing protein [Solirubrobacteraceae bacterium]
MAVSAATPSVTDALRTARLMCADADPPAGSGRFALRESRLRGAPAHLALSTGWRDHLSIAVAPAVSVRRALLGDRAQGMPRVLVRVDEFPHARAHDEPDRFGTAGYERFHEVMTGSGIPYLVAVLPRVAHDYLDPRGDIGDELAGDERAMLTRLREDGVEFGLHGHTHRTRDARPRHRSALTGMSGAELELALDGAEAALEPLGIRPRVFVPPFNHFDRAQYPVLARRYAVVCGGPESGPEMGLRPAPRWIEGSVYLPSYAPLYGRAAEVTAAIEALVAQRAAVWAPVTLHPGWEFEDDLRALSIMVRTIAPYVCPWGEFLSAVGDSAAVTA